MLLLLSPAKSLDFSPHSLPITATGTPRFLNEASQLITTLQKKTPRALTRLMALSEDLAQLNHARYQAWCRQDHDSDAAQPALAAFNGDTYQGLQAHSLDAAAIAWLQQHLRILSGLYGLLAPLDRILPYRLEMGTALTTRRGKNLYAYWRKTLPPAVIEAAQNSTSTTPVEIVNLASQEYAGVLPPAWRKASTPHIRWIDCIFEEWRGQRYQVISFNAKRARGMMARFAAQQQANSSTDLQGFTTDGYHFDAAASSPATLVFRRNQP